MDQPGHRPLPAASAQRRSNRPHGKCQATARESAQAEIQATGIPPQHDLESAVVAALPPGAYTVIVAGNGGGAGIGLVEAYRLQ